MKAPPLALALIVMSAPQTADAVPTATMQTAMTPTADTMRWHRRLLLIATPSPQDRQAIEQKRILDAWNHQAADRDISLVDVSGAQVTGLADRASSLRRRYALAPGRFEVLLIGKDGKVALRSARPIPADKLEATIDAMPMRRAGER